MLRSGAWPVALAIGRAGEPKDVGCLQRQPQRGHVRRAAERAPGQFLDPADAIGQAGLVDMQSACGGLPGTVLLQKHAQCMQQAGVRLLIMRCDRPQNTTKGIPCLFDGLGQPRQAVGDLRMMDDRSLGRAVGGRQARLSQGLGHAVRAVDRIAESQRSTEDVLHGPGIPGRDHNKNLLPPRQQQKGHLQPLEPPRPFRQRQRVGARDAQTVKALVGEQVLKSDRCCGESGTLGVTRPDVSTQVRFRKEEEIRKGEALLRASGAVGEKENVKILTSCPSCLQGLNRYQDDLQNGLLEADYIVIEMAREILGENWMPEYVHRANQGGIERVLV